MLSIFNLIKPTLVISSCTFALALHLGLQAQTNSDVSLSIGGQVAASTCLLVNQINSSRVVGGVRTYGLNDASSIIASMSKQVDEVIVTGQNGGPAITLSLVDADGVSACALPGTWDLGLDINSGDYVTTPSGGTYLISKGPGSPLSVGLRLQSGITSIGRSPLDLSKSVPPYGVLLSNRASRSLGLSTNEAITLKPELVRTSASAITTGTFSVSLPLNIWYK